MNALPDIDGIGGIVPNGWRILRERLIAIGLDAACVAPILALGLRFPEDDRNPIRLWHLRRRSDAASLTMRLLMFGDAITVHESVTVLGDRLHALLTESGLLPVRDDQVRCVLRLALAGDFFAFADDLAPGGDVVMGMRETTVPLWRAAVPTRPLQRALDLGCGAGAIALLLSRHASLVVASDINPRAVTLARVNVALNAADNVEVREGDLFAPVSGETFDLIAAHPPYVALPKGMPATSHIHGGPRGDEIACRLLDGLAAHLAPGGQAVVQAQWPLRQGETLAARIRDVAGPSLDLLVLSFGATDADDLATFWGQRGSATVARVRDHYARVGVVAAEASLCVLRRRNASPAWTETLDVTPGSASFVTAERIARVMRSRDLLHGSDADLQAARLRLPDGTSLANVASAAGTRAMLMLPPATLRQPVDVTPEAQRIIAAVNGAASVRDSGQNLAAVRQALASGALEPM
jgi:methylase of polypeptide subunit release factors